MKQIAVTRQDSERSSPLPTIAEIMEKAKRGVPAVTACGKCKYVSGVPSPRCPRCGSGSVQSRDEIGVGRIVSYSNLYVTGKVFAMYKPYAYVLVDLDSGARVSGWMLAEEIDSLGIGKRVKTVPHEGQALLFSLNEAA